MKIIGNENYSVNVSEDSQVRFEKAAKYLQTQTFGASVLASLALVTCDTIEQEIKLFNEEVILTQA